MSCAFNSLRLPTNLYYLILVDTVRVRVQTWPSSSRVPRSLNLLVGKPILPKLYAGLPVTIGFSAPALAVYYTAYDGMYHIVARTFVPNPKNVLTGVFFCFCFFFLGRVTLFPYSCQTLLGSHLVSVCVPYCEYNGTESQLDSTSAGVFALWADC